MSRILVAKVRSQISIEDDELMTLQITSFFDSIRQFLL